MLRVAPAILLCLAIGGCRFSPGAPDESLLKKTFEIAPSTSCRLDLSSSELNASQLRQLFGCLNRDHPYQGALDGLQALLEYPDAELEPLVWAVNQFGLGRMERVEAWSQAWADLHRALDPDTRRSLWEGLMAPSATGSGPGLATLWRILDLLDPEALVELLGATSSDQTECKDQIESKLALVDELSTLPAWPEFAHALTGVLRKLAHTPDLRQRLWKQWTDLPNQTPERVRWQRRLQRVRASGKLELSLRQGLGLTTLWEGGPAQPSGHEFARIEALARVLNQSNAQGQPRILPLQRALRSMASPIQCLRASVTISRPAELIVRELLDHTRKDTPIGMRLGAYLIRENPLGLALLQSPVCEIPGADLNEHYGALRELAFLPLPAPGAEQNAPMPVIATLVEALQPFVFLPGNSEVDPDLLRLLMQTLQEIEIAPTIEGFGLLLEHDAVLPGLLWGTSVPEEHWSAVFLREDPFIRTRSVFRSLPDPLAYVQLAQEIVSWDVARLHQRLRQLRLLWRSGALDPLLSGWESARRSPSGARQLPALLRWIRGDARPRWEEAWKKLSRFNDQPAALQRLIQDMLRLLRSSNSPRTDPVVLTLTASKPPSHTLTLARIAPLRYAMPEDAARYRPATYGMSPACLDIDFTTSPLRAAAVWPLLGIWLPNTFVGQFGSPTSASLAAFLECLGSGSAQLPGEDAPHASLVGIVRTLCRRMGTEGSDRSLWSQLLEAGARLFDLPGADYRYLLDHLLPDLTSVQASAGPRILRALATSWAPPLQQAPLPAALRLLGRMRTQRPTEVGAFSDFLVAELERSDFSEILGDLTQGLSGFSRAVTAIPEPPAPLGPWEAALRAQQAWLGPRGAPFTAQFLEHVAQWISAKEGIARGSGTAPDPPLVTRLAEVLNAARDGLNNFTELTHWRGADVHARLAPLIEKLGHTQYRPPGQGNQKPSLVAILDFFRGFTRSSDAKAYYDPYFLDWVTPEFSPDWLGAWFYERSRDYRPLALFDERGHYRVRLVNSLDLFEEVTFNSDFFAPAPINRNLGFRSSNLLANAWADSAPEYWPRLVREQTTPPRTMQEAINEMETPSPAAFDWRADWAHWRSALDWRVGMEDFRTLTSQHVGLPQMPSWVGPAPGEVRLPDVQWYGGYAGAYFLYPHVQKWRARLYNTWQVKEVMRDNTPDQDPLRLGPQGPESNYARRYPGGLEFFRNIYFQLANANPPEDRVDYDDLSLGRDNNDLTLIDHSNRIGFMRIVSHLLHDVDAQDPAFRDFMGFMSDLVTSSTATELLTDLFSTPDHRQLVLQMAEGWVKGLLETPAKAAPVRRILYYGGASAHRTGLGRLPLQQLKEALLGPTWRAFLSSPLDTGKTFIAELVGSEEAARLLENFYYWLIQPKFGGTQIERIQEFLTRTAQHVPSLIQMGLNLFAAIYEDPQSRRDWHILIGGIDRIIAQNTNLPELGLALLRFFAETDLDVQGNIRPAAEKTLARHLRLNIARSLKQRDFDPLLQFAVDQPDDLNEILRTLRTYLADPPPVMREKRSPLVQFLQWVEGKLARCG